MVPILLGGIAVVSAISYLLNTDNSKFSNKANAHKHFLIFESNISISNEKKKILILARKALQKKIVDYFTSQTKLPIPKFYIQGSYKMKTMVVKKDGSYDVDLGVYFLDKPNIEPITLQKHIIKAVKNHTSLGVKHKDKCVRVIYKSDFDIDLPVYYKTLNDNSPFLATKNEWWESDPKELCDWFENKRKEKDNNGQMIRLIKYFKAWSHNKANKMPSGIAFTIWVTTYYQQDDRDDISFFNTAKSIYNSFSWGTSSINPATPFDDFLDRLNTDQISVFKAEFKRLLKNSELALYQKDNLTALKKWGKIFGNKFPINSL